MSSVFDSIVRYLILAFVTLVAVHDIQPALFLFTMVSIVICISIDALHVLAYVEERRMKALDEKLKLETRHVPGRNHGAMAIFLTPFLAIAYLSVR